MFRRLQGVAGGGGGSSSYYNETDILRSENKLFVLFILYFANKLISLDSHMLFGIMDNSLNE